MHRQQGKHFVAVQHLSVFVAQDATITITIVRNAKPGAGRKDLGREFFRMFAAHAVVDVVAIGLIANRENLGPERAQHHRTCQRSRAIRRIQNNFPSGQRLRRQQGARRRNIAGHRRPILRHRHNRQLA